MGGFFSPFFLLARLFFHGAGFLGQRVVESSRCYWDVVSVSWSGYLMGFYGLAKVGRTVSIESGLHAARGSDCARTSQESDFAVDGDRRLTCMQIGVRICAACEILDSNVPAVEPSGQSREKSTATNVSWRIT